MAAIGFHHMKGANRAMLCKDVIHHVLKSAVICALTAAAPAGMLPHTLSSASADILMGYYSTEQLEPEDPWASLEKSVLDARDKLDEFIKTAEENFRHAKVLEDGYILSRACYQDVLECLKCTQTDGTLDKKALGKLSSSLSRFRKWAEAVYREYPNDKYISELFGDALYFTPAKADATVLHYKAFILGRRSGAILEKLALDFHSMSSNATVGADGELDKSRHVGQKFHNRFLLPPDRSFLTDEDREVLSSMARYYAERTQQVRGAMEQFEAIRETILKRHVIGSTYC